MKCSRCGGTEQVQRTLMPEVPALCIRCIETEREKQAVDIFTIGARA